MKTCDTERAKIAVFNDVFGSKGDCSTLVFRLSGSINLTKDIQKKILEKSNNCIFKKNVFFSNYRLTFFVTAIANSKGPCRIVIVNSDYIVYSIMHLFTTAKTKNVKVSVGTNLTNPFFEFKLVFISIL